MRIPIKQPGWLMESIGVFFVVINIPLICSLNISHIVGTCWFTGYVTYQMRFWCQFFWTVFFFQAPYGRPRLSEVGNENREMGVWGVGSGRGGYHLVEACRGMGSSDPTVIHVGPKSLVLDPWWAREVQRNVQCFLLIFQSKHMAMLARNWILASKA